MNVTRGGDWEEERHHRVYRTHVGSSLVGWAVGRRFGHQHNTRQPTKTFTTLDVRLDGMLWKQGSWRKNWKQRFFILRRDALRLSYYDSAKSLNLLGEVVLVDATHGQGAPRLAVLSPVGEDDGPGTAGFAVRCAATGRELRLRSATSYDRDKWLRAIRLAMQRGLREISKVDDKPKARTLAEQQGDYAEAPPWDAPAPLQFSSDAAAKLRSTSKRIGSDALGLHVTVHLTHAAYNAQDGMFVVLFVQASPMDPQNRLDAPSPVKGHYAEPAGRRSSPSEVQLSAKAKSAVRVNKGMVNHSSRHDDRQTEHAEEASCFSSEHVIDAYLDVRPCEEEADDVTLEEETDDEEDEPKSSHGACSPLREQSDDLHFPDDYDRMCRSTDSALQKSPTTLVHGRLNVRAKDVVAGEPASPRGDSILTRTSTLESSAARGVVVSSNNKRWRELARTEVVRAGDSGAFTCQADRGIDIVRQFTVLLPSPGRWKGNCALIAVYRRLNDGDALRRHSRIMWVELDAPAIARLADQPCSRIVELNLVDKHEGIQSEDNAGRATAASAKAGTIPAANEAEHSSTMSSPPNHVPSKRSNFHLSRKQRGNTKRLSPVRPAPSTNEISSSNSPEELVEQLPTEGRLLIVGVEAAGVMPCGDHFYARQHYQFRSLVNSVPDTGRKNETCYSYVLVSEALGAPQCAVALPAALLELVVAERRKLALDIIERVHEAAIEKRALAEKLKVKAKEAALAVSEKTRARAEAQALVTAVCQQAQEGGIRDDSAPLMSHPSQTVKQPHDDMTTLTKRLKLVRLDEEAAIDRNRELSLISAKIDALASEFEAVGRQLAHYSDELDSVYARGRDILLSRLREAVYTTSPDSDDTRLKNIHVSESVGMTVDKFLKRSTQKKDRDLQFAPTNLNLHIVRARGQLNATLDSRQSQSSGTTESFIDNESSLNAGSTLMTRSSRVTSPAGSPSGSTIITPKIGDCASQWSSLECRRSEDMRSRRARRSKSAPPCGEYEQGLESTNFDSATMTETADTATAPEAREDNDDLVHSTVTFGATAAHVKHLGFKDGGLSRLLDKAPARPPLKVSLSKQQQHQQTLSAAWNVEEPALTGSSSFDTGAAMTADDHNDDRNGAADFAVAQMLLGAPSEQRKARVLQCVSLHLFGGLDAATVPVIEECAQGVARQGRTRTGSDQRPSGLEPLPSQSSSSLQGSGKASFKSAAISFAARALLASRVDVVISQALALAGAHVEAVIGQANPSILERTVATTSAGPGRLLLGIECLLSTLNDELGMIEDLVVATEWLSTLTCRFIVRRDKTKRELNEEASLPSSMCRVMPSEDGQRHFRQRQWRVQRSSHGNGTLVADFIIEGEVADLIERLAGNHQSQTGPIEVEDGFRIVATTRVEAVLFSQGINEWQTVANNLGAASLQAEVNAESIRTLSNHVDWAERVVRELALGDAGRAARADADVKRWRQLLASASDAVLDSSSASKNVHVLLKTSDLCRALIGSHCICCKSGKDRTSMAVTLEQTRSLATYLGVFDERRVCKLLRRHGVRRVNIIANTSQDKYAFNTVQVRSLPRCYRPPSGTYSGNTPT